MEPKTGGPGPSIDAFMPAGHREDAAMLLPGEQGGVTVFEIRSGTGAGI